MLSGLSGQAAMVLICLAVVLGLIMAAARAARLLPSVRQATRSEGALALRGTLALDARRRVYLVETEGRQALILTGGGGDMLVCLPPAGC